MRFSLPISSRSAGSLRESAVGDRVADAQQFLLHHAAGADVHVPDLGIAHLPVRQADIAAGGVQEAHAGTSATAGRSSACSPAARRCRRFPRASRSRRGSPASRGAGRPAWCVSSGGNAPAGPPPPRRNNAAIRGASGAQGAVVRVARGDRLRPPEQPLGQHRAHQRVRPGERPSDSTASTRASTRASSPSAPPIRKQSGRLLARQPASNAASPSLPGAAPAMSSATAKPPAGRAASSASASRRRISAALPRPSGSSVSSRRGRSRAA